MISESDCMKYLALFSAACAAVAVYYARRSARAAEKALERANLIPEVTPQKDAPWPGWHMITIDMLNPGPATTVVTGIRTPKHWLPWPRRARIILHADLPRETHRTQQRNEFLRTTSEQERVTLTKAPPSDPGSHAIADLNLRVPRSGSKPLRLVVAIPASSPVPDHLELIAHWADQRNQPKIIKVFVL